MNMPIAPPPPPDPRGSLLVGFLIAWGALIGGYIAAVSLMAAAAPMAGGADGFFIMLGLSPWALIIGFIIWFANLGKTQTAKGVAIGLASIVAILLLLIAACFSLFSGASFR
jgi:hypothetical protein